MTIKTDPQLPLARKAPPGHVLMPAIHRATSIVAGSLDDKTREFDIVFTAGAEVERFDYWTGVRYVEVLEVSETAIRLGRLQSGATPVLDSHARYSLENVLGVVIKDSVKIAGGEGLARVRMSARDGVAAIVSDIRDGIIANISCGYFTHAYREEKRGDKLYRVATDWEPFEVSFVPVGADAAAGKRGIVRPQDNSDATFVTCRADILNDKPPQIERAALARMRMNQATVAVR